jgi:hypothetical protein
MTLARRAQDLRERIDAVIRLGKAHKEAESVRARASELKASRQQLETTLAKASVLAKQTNASLKVPDVSAASTNLTDYSNALRDAGAADTGKDYARFRRSLSKVIGDLGKVVETALDAIEKDAPNIDETFLKQVELIPGYAPRVQEIRRERDALLTGRDLSAMDAAQLSIFLKKREAVKTLTDRLDVKEIPKDVLDFFSAARRQPGAPLEKFTEAVRRWLEDRDQLKNLRIVVVSR